MIGDSVGQQEGGMEAFAAVFAALEDPRTGNAKRHLLLEILLIALCTLLSGGETCADMALFGRAKQGFLGRFLRLERPISPRPASSFSTARSRCAPIVRSSTKPCRRCSSSTAAAG